MKKQEVYVDTAQTIVKWNYVDTKGFFVHLKKSDAITFATLCVLQIYLK